MRKKAHGQIRRGQVISTYGPGALIDLPKDSAIVGGLDTWLPKGDLEEIHEPRLAGKLQDMTGIVAPKLYAPPAAPNDPRETNTSIGAYRFPVWYVVQETEATKDRKQSRRMVERRALEKGRFEGLPVVPTRFVRACPQGHVADLDWRRFVHEECTNCTRQLWLDEQGTTGDLSDLTVRCECGCSRNLIEAKMLEDNPLGSCPGSRPWLGPHAHEDCGQPSRLLIRSASNAYFPQIMSTLSLPDRGSEIEKVVGKLWDFLDTVESAADLAFMKKKAKVAQALVTFEDEEVLEAIETRRSGKSTDKPVKQVELEALLAAPDGYGDDTPIDPDFHARRLPDDAWRRSKVSDEIESIIQVHRLREVRALVGFTRFEAYTPDIHGEYDTDVRRADLALDPEWFPAVENRGEGIFLQLRAQAVRKWLKLGPVRDRLKELQEGHKIWAKDRNIGREFPGGPYVLLHTLSHLLVESLSMRCGYPTSSIRERIYSDLEHRQFGILLYTSSPDAEGTLGGLVQEARHIESHMMHALQSGRLCSNDPICAQHSPQDKLDDRSLHGASCHGCVLIPETSCEMRNDYLDRALVVPTLLTPKAAFFADPR